jgi:hypothetical protein
MITTSRLTDVQYLNSFFLGDYGTSIAVRIAFCSSSVYRIITDFSNHCTDQSIPRLSTLVRHRPKIDTKSQLTQIK